MEENLNYLLHSKCKFHSFMKEMLKKCVITHIGYYDWIIKLTQVS